MDVPHVIATAPPATNSSISPRTPTPLQAAEEGTGRGYDDGVKDLSGGERHSQSLSLEHRRRKVVIETTLVAAG